MSMSLEWARPAPKTAWVACFVEITALAAGQGVGEGGQGVLVRDEGGGGVGILLFDHGSYALVGVLEQVGEDGEFGKVGPVADGHFGLHGAGIEAGRVEDGAVVAAPEGGQLVRLGSLAAGDAGAVGELVRSWVPGDGGVGGEDGPAQDGEAFGEKGGGEREDAVVGAVPGYVVLLRLTRGVVWVCRGLRDEQIGSEVAPCGCRVRCREELRGGNVGGRGLLEQAEAHKGVHLVKIAADLVLKAVEAGDILIQLVFQQLAILLQAPESSVEELPTAGVGVAGDDLGKVEKGFRDRGRRRRDRCLERRVGWAEVGFVRELEVEVLFGLSGRQLDGVGWDAGEEKLTGLVAPGGEIRLDDQPGFRRDSGCGRREEAHS
jgi:hypothetical protein